MFTMYLKLVKASSINDLENIPACWTLGPPSQCGQSATLTPHPLPASGKNMVLNLKF